MSDKVKARVKQTMREAEAAAWRSLGGYKFWMFGYHAATWVKMNRQLPACERKPNPFYGLVQMARHRPVKDN